MQPITIWRRITQIGFAVITGEWLVIGWLRCPFGVPFVSCSSCPLGDCPGRYLFVPFLFLIGLASLLFGRVFCGWACPMGLIEDALSRLPKPGNRFRIAWAKADRILKWVKWPVLALIVWAVFAYNNQTDQRSWEYVVRSPSVFEAQSYELAWGLGGGAYQIRFALLMVGLIGAFFVTRFWCRYLCPLGALLSVFNKFSIFGLRKHRYTCINCNKYPKECIQYTCPETVDCVVCGDCVQGCPSKSIGLGKQNNDALATSNPKPHGVSNENPLEE